MFGNRPNAQKPGEGLITKFQATFSDIVRPTKCDPPGPTSYNKLDRGTPGLRFTPLLNDRSGLRFTSFIDDQSIPTPSLNLSPQNSNYNPGGLNTVFHGPAGDLHTPLVKSTLMTPNTLLEQFAVSPIQRNNIDPFHDLADVQHWTWEPQNKGSGNHNAGYPPGAFVQSHLADGAADGTSEATFLSDVDNQGKLYSQYIHSPGNKSSSRDDDQ
ncbi:hypothetical protein N7508_011065 [Penicillium antarcticum]|uniref:uncharacterized protein n=1 Tax=Penicillium antarcticum TaxID=416450 RepID=UPI00238F054C|nr:uncharacterized protein N7508_011065 [Penicillium antarcticum]KAJ5288290.1 hypothetical protein N7508_011065 [Penicillium antarcticum]